MMDKKITVGWEKEPNFMNLWESIKNSNILVIGDPERQRVWGRKKKKKTVVNDFAKLLKYINLQIKKILIGSPDILVVAKKTEELVEPVNSRL